MNNYERIKNMNIEEMAELLYGICHERDVIMINKLNHLGVKADLLELPAESIINHLNWLKREVKE